MPPLRAARHGGKKFCRSCGAALTPAAAKFPAAEAYTPKQLLDVSSTVTTADADVTVALDKRAHNAYLVVSRLTDQPTPMPCFGGEALRLGFA